MTPVHERIRYKTFGQFTFSDLEVFAHLPDHPFWSHVASKIDFSFADRLCSVLYSGRGQYPYAPSLKLKVHLVQAYYNLSDRQMEEKIMGDLFIKRFLGVPAGFFGFDHSTIGLDRSRMGHAMFQACHMYCLAQLLHHGLWGDKDEQWIIDSFPSYSHAVIQGSYRLIQKAVVRLVQHTKRNFRQAYECFVAELDLDLDQMATYPPKEAKPYERLLAFSKLTAQAHSLLNWFETEQALTRIGTDKQKSKPRERLLELRQVLEKILRDYTRVAQGSSDSGEDEAKTEDDKPIASEGAQEASEDIAQQVQDEQPSPPENETQPAPEEARVEYEKVPVSERPSDRIVSASAPDVRVGMKNARTKIKGYKFQVVSTTGGIIVNTQVVPAMEHDRDAMPNMVKEVQNFFQLTPSAVIGDTAYGHGKQRVQMEAMGIKIIAPVSPTQSPTKLLDISQFTYHKEKDVFVCPQGKETIRKRPNEGLAGTQYYFGKANCSQCPLREKCTTNKNGRTVFLSDYHEQYEKAKAFNETDEGKEAFRRRYVVERKNQELKNDCGLGLTHVTRHTTLNIKAKAAAMVVNLKLMVRKLVAPNPGFLRRAPRTVNPV